MVKLRMKMSMKMGGEARMKTGGGASKEIRAALDAKTTVSVSCWKQMAVLVWIFLCADGIAWQCRVGMWRQMR